MTSALPHTFSIKFYLQSGRYNFRKDWPPFYSRTVHHPPRANAQQDCQHICQILPKQNRNKLLPNRSWSKKFKRLLVRTIVKYSSCYFNTLLSLSTTWTIFQKVNFLSWASKTWAFDSPGIPLTVSTFVDEKSLVVVSALSWEAACLQNVRLLVHLIKTFNNAKWFVISGERLHIWITMLTQQIKRGGSTIFSNKVPHATSSYRNRK